MNYLTGDEEVRRLAELREKWDLEYTASMDNARKAGMEDGRKLGLEDGRKLGLEDGRKLGLEDGRKLGLEEGKKAGEKSAKLETAKKFLELGVDIEKIVQATGLAKEEIESL
jgi:flagellar biosynthesis/type III secretory pathway protein FliH